MTDGALTYAYGANGNRSSIGYPEGVTTVYTYDFADREQSLTVERPGEPDLPIASGAQYDPSGPLARLDLGNALSEQRTFTDRYFPGSISVEPTAPLTGAPCPQCPDCATGEMGNTPILDTITLGLSGAKSYAYGPI